MDINYWSVRLSSRRGRDGVKKGDWAERVVILASKKFHIIRVNNNLVKDPSNSKSIFYYLDKRGSLTQ